MLGRLRQLLGGRAELGHSDDAAPLLHRLPVVSPGRRSPCDPALLPVRTKVRPLGASPVAGSSAAGKRSSSSRRRQVGAGVLLLSVLALVAAGVTTTALSCYALSTLYEPPAAVAAAVAEAHAAAAAAAARAVPAAAIAPHSALQPQVLQRQLQLPAQAQPHQQRLTANYTVVVMSYAKRLRTLPLVVNKLGSCPSGGLVAGWL